MKLALGLGAALAVGALHLGPLGAADRFVERIEAQGRAAIARTEIEGVEMRMRRAPLTRTAILSGPADDFQREGMGSYPGLNDRILAIPGVARVEWANPPPPREP